MEGQNLVVHPLWGPNFKAYQGQGQRESVGLCVLLDLVVCCGFLCRLMSVNRWVGLLIDAQV